VSALHVPSDSDEEIARPQDAAQGAPGAANPPTRHVRDFAELARRLSGWTTNLLAIGVLSVGALVAAARVTEWWRSEPQGVTFMAPGALALPWNSPDGAVLEFGAHPWRIHRQSLHGTATDAEKLLAALCRDVAVRDWRVMPQTTVDPAERALLERLKNWAPLEEEKGQWRLSAVGGPTPWIVGTTDAAGRPDSLTANTAEADAFSGRVLCWGLALPQPDGLWTLYVLERRPNEAPSAAPDVPLPAGAKRVLRIRGAQGGEFTSFRVDGAAAQWRRDFDASFRAAGWYRLGEWTGGGNAYNVTYLRESVPARLRADITLTEDAGRWTGVAVVIPEMSDDQ
jgi:hypothetical protein